MTVALIKKGFQKCGIISLKHNPVDTSRLSDNSSKPPAPSSNLSNPNPPTSADKNTSLLPKRLLTQVQVPQPQSTVSHQTL